MNILSEKVNANTKPACKKEIEPDNTRQEDGEHHHTTRLVSVPQRFYEYVIRVSHITLTLNCIAFGSQ
jgi:hypothetical protein